MKYILIGLLKVYRLFISPLYGNVCRYYPSCSAYALRAVEFHGALRGTGYAARRLLSCHPWSRGGYDPVPGTPEFCAELHEQAAAAGTLDTEPAPTSTGHADCGGRHSPRGRRHLQSSGTVLVPQARGVS